MLNTANKLTLLRIILVPFVVIFLIAPISHGNIFAIILFLIASITDYFDGEIARKNDQITIFGKFLDPLADKVLIISILLCFLDKALVPLVPILIIVAREFIVTSVRLVANAKENFVIPANFFGKIKTVLQFCTIFTILLNDIFKISSYLFLNTFFIWLCAIFSLISGIIYIYRNTEYLKQ